MLDSAAAGLLTGLTLIVAIGAQNAFVLRQGLAREHVALVVAICAVSDLVLIVAGVAGIGTIVEQAGWADRRGPLARRRVPDRVRRAVAARRARRADALRRRRTGAALASRPCSRATALTWLNPHVYLDTVLLLGSIANTHGADGRWWFAVGAGLASLLWFSGSGLRRPAASPLLARPRAWQVSTS